MIKRDKKIPALISIFLLLAVPVVINFCHTEGIKGTDTSCPACRFLSSSLVVAQIDFFLLPIFSFLEMLGAEVRQDYTALVVAEFPARSPPVV